MILQIINEQLVTMCKFIYLILFAFKNHYSTEVNRIGMYDKRYSEATTKIKEYIVKYTKKRKDYNSPYLFFEIQDFFLENLNYLTERLRNFPNEKFVLRLFFEDSRSYCGVPVHMSINKMIKKNLFESYRLNLVPGFMQNVNVNNNSSSGLSSELQ